MVKKILFRTISIGAKAITMEKRDLAQLQIWQRQLGIYDPEQSRRVSG